MDSINSKRIFTTNWLCWKVVGISRHEVSWEYLFWAYSIFLNVTVTVFYPIHLWLGIFTNEREGDFMKTVSLAGSSVACSVKVFLYARKMHKLRELESLLERLDKRATSVEERTHFKSTLVITNTMRYSFAMLCSGMFIFAALTVLLRKDRSLYQPAWFPWDWRSSEWLCNVSNLCQLYLLAVALLQNFTDDTYPMLVLCVLASHVKMLGMRLARIGYTSTNQLENEMELLKCIEDQKILYSMYDMVQGIISLTMFTQLVLTAFTACSVLMGLLFYAQTAVEQIFYVFYLTALELEIFPTCYYGADVQLFLSKLHYDAFSSNWMDQSRNFKKHMMLLTERSLQPSIIMAANIVPIHLTTFFGILKATYSLFTVTLKIKN